MTLIRSLTFRRLAAAFGLLVVIVSGVLLVQLNRTTGALEARHLAALRSDSLGLQTLYEQRRIVALRQALEYRISIGADSGQLLLLQDRQGTVLAGNISAPPAGIRFGTGSIGDTDLQSTRIEATEYDVLATQLPGGFPLVVGHARTAISAEIRSQRTNAIVAILALILLACATCYLASRTLLRHLAEVNTVAAAISAGQRDRRFGAPYSPDEFGALKNHLDVMLDRIIALILAHQNLSDTVAHELRTPLNRINQKLERITGQTETVEDLRAELHATVRIFDSLLSISAAEARRGETVGFSMVNLSTLCADLAELYEPLAEDTGLVLLCETEPDQTVLGDQVLLTQLLTNLIENALKFCNPGDEIRLGARPSGHAVVLFVTDTGPGLPAEISQTAFHSFVRGRSTQSARGHGLGLSLVRAIALRHGAKLELPQQDKGLSIEIRFEARFGPGDGKGD